MAEEIAVVAASTDSQEKASETVNELGLRFPIGYGLPLETASVLGAFYEERRWNPACHRVCPETGSHDRCRPVQLGANRPTRMARRARARPVSKEAGALMPCRREDGHAGSALLRLIRRR